jgi:hypothetical protein
MMELSPDVPVAMMVWVQKVKMHNIFYPLMNVNYAIAHLVGFLQQE